MVFPTDTPELSKLTEKLSALAAEVHRRVAQQPAGGVTASGSLVAIAQLLLRQRQLRRAFLPPSLFHEPAWELLLSLFVMRGEQDMTMKRVVALVDAPVTTSQRWVDQLVHMRLLQRVEDPVDRRRVNISLTARGEDAVAAYLASLGSPGSDQQLTARAA